MSRLDNPVKKDATRVPPLIVCPYCGPENLSYAGRIVTVVCKQCRQEMREASE